MASYFCLNSNSKTKKKNQITFPLPDVLVACREIGSLPEQVKQKANLCDYNIQR